MQVAGFETLNKLGEGGMATVWKARQVSLDRIVAIKVLSSQFTADPGDVARFHSEAQSAAKLKHPGIVQVYDASMQEGFYYFVMEFIDGYTVGEWMQRSGPLSEKDALLVAECVGEALKHAWDKEGIIHCDIKPDNIMVDEDGTVKVADLGLARTLSVMSGSSLTQAREILGTPAFMSPEQARGDVRLDCRADIYSLGATLYFMVTGTLLFEGRTDEEIIDLQMEGTVDDPATLNPRLSRGMCLLIESMLAKSPEDRPKNWDAALQDIRRVKRRLPPHQVLKTDRVSTVRPNRSRPKVAPSRTYMEPDSPASAPWLKWGIAAGAVAVLVGLAILLGRQPPPPPLPAVAWETEPHTAYPVAAALPVPGAFADETARDMFEFAKQWAADHPDRVSEAIRKFQEVARQTRGTRYALMANDEVARLNAERNSAVNDVMSELRQATDGLRQERRFMAAANLYRHYQGAYAEESRARRDQAVQRLEELQREWDAGEERRRIESEQRFENTLASVAETLLLEGCASALKALDEVLAESMSADQASVLKTIREAVALAASVNDRIMNSFRAHIGQDAAVDLLSRRIQVRVTAVTPDGVQGQESRPMGSGVIRSPVVFGLSELAPREKLMRMGRDSDPGVPLAKGLLAYESNALDHARRYFNDAPPPLNELLPSAMDKLAQAALESQAEQALSNLLRQFGVDVAGAYDMDAWLGSVREKIFAAEDIERLRNEIQRYRESCGDTLFAQDAEPFLGELAALQAQGSGTTALRSPDTPPDRVRDPDLRLLPDAGPFEDVFGAIVKQNPMIDPDGDIQASVDSENRLRRLDAISENLESMTPFGILADLRILHVGGVPFNRRHHSRPVAPVSDLAPLNPLRLETLYVGQTSVKDLSPLEGMPLRELYVGGTQVESLMPLRNMALETLDIQRTAVRDLTPLRGMPMRNFNASGADRLFDFRPLSALPLRTLDLSSTQIRDIGFLKDMPLERLNLSDTRVHNFTMLRSLPLRHLELSSTQIKDIALFRGQRLETLNLRDTGVNNVDVLRGMPLTSLTLAGTLVQDFSPLQNLPLTHLDVAGCRLDDLAWAERLPLRHLVLARTAVRDLSPLKDKAFNYLNISHTQVRDLNALRLFSVRHLSMRGVKADLQPLAGMSLTALDLDNPENHIPLLRRIKGLQRINGMTFVQLLESLRGGGQGPGRRPPPQRRR